MKFKIEHDGTRVHRIYVRRWWFGVISYWDYVGIEHGAHEAEGRCRAIAGNTQYLEV